MQIAGYSLMPNPERSMDYVRRPSWIEKEMMHLEEISGTDDEKQALKSAAMVVAGVLGVCILISRL